MSKILRDRLFDLKRDNQKEKSYKYHEKSKSISYTYEHFPKSAFSSNLLKSIWISIEK